MGAGTHLCMIHEFECKTALYINTLGEDRRIPNMENVKEAWFVMEPPASRSPKSA